MGEAEVKNEKSKSRFSGLALFSLPKENTQTRSRNYKHIIKSITVNKMKAAYIKNRDTHIRADSTAQQNICLYRQTSSFRTDTK